MTHKAHEIGMSRTLYRDASGLPNDEQLTTAHDLALLGETTQKRFPQYFHYFSLREFNYDGQTIGNHDHLLGRIDGVDGIKTGYTRGSGFNLLTSLHRDGRSLVAVVMGGISGPSRDRLMARLIESHYRRGLGGRRRRRGSPKRRRWRRPWAARRRERPPRSRTSPLWRRPCATWSRRARATIATAIRAPRPPPREADKVELGAARQGDGARPQQARLANRPAG